MGVRLSVFNFLVIDRCVGVFCVGVGTFVCSGEPLVFVGPPLILLHHCFSSLGQETAVDSGIEVGHTQPFQGYSALPGNINQTA